MPLDANILAQFNGRYTPMQMRTITHRFSQRGKLPPWFVGGDERDDDSDEGAGTGPVVPIATVRSGRVPAGRTLADRKAEKKLSEG